MKKLYTIGYEGASLDAFLDVLEKARVRTLVDIRELPISRRRGFSKNALKDALSTRKIQYLHEPELGSPKAIRHKYREDGNFDRFIHAFDRHLSSKKDLLHRLADGLDHGTVLMCYERDHSKCHRSSVVSALTELTGFIATHLEAPPNGGQKCTDRKVPHSRQGVSAA